MALVSESARVNANIGVSHIDPIVSELPTSLTPTPRFISQTTIWIYCFGQNYYRVFVRVILRPSVFSVSYGTKILRASERSLADLPRACLDRVCPRTVRASSRELFFASRQNPLTPIPVNQPSSATFALWKYHMSLSCYIILPAQYLISSLIVVTVHDKTKA